MFSFPAELHWCIFGIVLTAGLVAAIDSKQGLKQEFFKVYEEDPIGTKVGIISPGGFKNADFSFFDHVDEFKLDHGTGLLTTNKVFDREKLSKDIRVHGFKLHIHRNSDLIEVVVSIKDKNDQKPTFPVSYFKTNVLENIVANHAIAFPNAVDLDENENAVVLYKIVSGDRFKNFKIEPRQYNGVETYSLVRALNRPLDVEKQTNQLNLNISACDKLNPSWCSYLMVTLNIEDVNDNTPVIDPPLKDLIEIYENTTMDKPIFRVNATDADTGSNGEVTYRIFDSTIKEFAINKNTGEIYVMTKNLDAETRNSFTLLIIAQDKGRNPHKATLRLHIKVLDCNDERPLLKIHLNTISENFFNILEGSKVGITVGTITVTDDDITAENNQITGVALTRGNDFFALKEDYTVNDIAGKKAWSYTIYLTKIIDREVTPTIMLSAQATDNGSPSLTGSANFTVSIADVNDNSPIFSKSFYNAQVNESELPGKLILKVSATDKDFSQNGEISYSIVSKFGGMQSFYIDEHTGEIFLSDHIDREAHSYVLLNISARDHGIPTLTSHVLVNITVLDVNDNDPMFTNNKMEFNVTENNINGSSIGKTLSQNLVYNSRI